VYRAVVPEWSAVVALEALFLTVLGSLARLGAPVGPPREASETTEEDMRDSLPPQEGAYRRPLAMSGQILGWAALGLVAWWIWAVWRVERAVPWPPAHVVAAVCLAALWTVAAVRGRRRLYGRLAAWLTLGAVVTAAGWFGTHRHSTDVRGVLALGTALTGFVMASAVMFGPRRQGDTPSAWQEVLSPACLETAVLGAVPALMLALLSLTWPLHGLTAGLLAATAFLFARDSWLMRSDWPARLRC